MQTNDEVAFPTTSPQPDRGSLISDVPVSNPGTYHVFVRGYAIGGESNGLHVGLDGQLEGPGLDASNISDFRPHHAWRWDADRKHGFSAPARIDLPAGDHTLHVWNRDDGFRFDKIVLRKASAQPEETGPDESDTAR